MSCPIVNFLRNDDVLHLVRISVMTELPSMFWPFVGAGDTVPCRVAGRLERSPFLCRESLFTSPTFAVRWTRFDNSDSWSEPVFVIE